MKPRPKPCPQKIPSTLRILHVGKSHALCSGIGVGLALSPAGFNFFRQTLPYTADFAVIAKAGPDIVGFVRFRLTDQNDYQMINPKCNTWVRSHGTWVSAKYRRQGLALRLWKTLMRRPGVKGVQVSCITKASYRLLHQVAGLHPFVDFKISYMGD